MQHQDFAFFIAESSLHVPQVSPIHDEDAVIVFIIRVSYLSCTPFLKRDVMFQLPIFFIIISAIGLLHIFPRQTKSIFTLFSDMLQYNLIVVNYCFLNQIYDKSLSAFFQSDLPMFSAIIKKRSQGDRHGDVRNKTFFAHIVPENCTIVSKSAVFTHVKRNFPGPNNTNQYT